MGTCAHTHSHFPLFRWKNEKQNAAQTRSKIKHLFEGDELQLKAEIGSYGLEHERKKKQLTDTQDGLEQEKGKLRRIAGRLEDADRKFAQKSQEAAREQDLYEERAEYMADLCKRLDIEPGFNVANNNAQATAFIPTITEKLAAQRAQGQAMERGFRDDEGKLDTEVGKYREEEVRLGSEIASLEKQCQQLRVELSAQKKSADSAENNRKLLSEVQNKIKLLQEAKEQFERNCNREAATEEIAGLRRQQTEVEDDIENITMQIMESDTYATVKRDVAAKEAQIGERKSEIKRLKNKHRENLVRLFGDGGEEGNYRKRVEALHQNLLTKVTHLDASIRTQSQDKADLTARVRTTKSDLKQLEIEIGRIEEDIEVVCESMPFAVVLDTTKEKVERLQMEHSSLKSSENYYKR